MLLCAGLSIWVFIAGCTVLMTAGALLQWGWGAVWHDVLRRPRREWSYADSRRFNSTCRAMLWGWGLTLLGALLFAPMFITAHSR